MSDTSRYEADPAKAERAVEAMENLGTHVFNLATRFRNGTNLEVLGNDKSFGAPAKRAAIQLVDELATGVEAASRLLLAVPMALRANQSSVLNQQRRVLTAVHDAGARGGWRTPGSGGRK
ncbi:hypothetical protein AB0L00_21005 [Actinoallomurus sp. NPDC052308]|uniref:hypothetical protein n=1 Tax=Actinoallomurus sp. NPDC052308 TaxID=3155530 RepID=UPI00343E715A